MTSKSCAICILMTKPIPALSYRNAVLKGIKINHMVIQVLRDTIRSKTSQVY